MYADQGALSPIVSHLSAALASVLRPDLPCTRPIRRSRKSNGTATRVPVSTQQGQLPPDITGKGGQQTAHDDWQRHEESVPATSLPPQTILGTHQWWVNRCSLFHLAQLWCPYWGCLPRTHDAQPSYAGPCRQPGLCWNLPDTSRHGKLFSPNPWAIGRSLPSNLCNTRMTCKRGSRPRRTLLSKPRSTSIKLDKKQAKRKRNLPGTAAGSSVEKVTQSIPRNWLHPKQPRCEVDEPHVANRQRVEQPSRDDVNPCSPLSRLVNHDPRVCWPNSHWTWNGLFCDFWHRNWSHSIEEEDVFCLSGVHGKMPIFLDLMLPWTKSIIGQPQVVPRHAENCLKVLEVIFLPMGRFLTQRDLQQLAAGSALMLANMKIESGVVIRGGAALLEHPAESSPIQQTLCGAAPGAQRRSQQWKYGAQAIKPTTIRVIGLPPSAKFFARTDHSCSKAAWGILAGRDKSTAHFKDRPGPVLLATSVQNLCTGLTQRQRSEGARCPLSCRIKHGWFLWQVCLLEIFPATIFRTTNHSVDCPLFVPQLQEATVSAAAEKSG